MSWMSMLYKTYENNIELAGMSVDNQILPVVAHMVATAHVEIEIDCDGNFINASVIDKDRGRTLIPVTESSAGRASGVSPHALCDTLSYIAGDFADYTEGKVKDKAEEKFAAYSENLSAWVHSEFSHIKAEAVYQYISKKEVIKDLLNQNILIYPEDGKLTPKNIKGVISDKVLVRFRVDGDNIDESSNVWEDKTLMNAYTNFYVQSKPEKQDFCYLKAEELVISTNHPKGIVPANYGAKIVSANEEKNKNEFIYCGRFRDASEAYALSYEASQKAHHALTWLVAKQGITIGNKYKRTYICWNPLGKKVLDFSDDIMSIEDDDNISLTEPEYKRYLLNTIQGYRNQLDDNDDIVIIALEAATTGRLSVTYYNELKSSDFYNRIQDWYEKCIWHFTVKEKTDMPIGSPKIVNIVRYAYGNQMDKLVVAEDKVLKEQVQRLYHCMLDRKPIATELMRAICIKASTPMAYNKSNREKVLETACAVIKMYYKGGIKMELDYENRDRSYLFGRLLAVCEQVERSTFSMDEDREANAIRLQASFASRPAQTWKVLEEKLLPYYQKLNPGSRMFFKDLVGNIISNFEDKDLKANKALDEQYLIGYYLQRKELRTKKDK